jgi:hypothetical protein
MKGAWHAVSMGEMKNIYKIVVRKRDRYGPLGRPRNRWNDYYNEC